MSTITRPQLKKLTITVDPAVYRGLYSHVGKGRIGKYLSDLARPFVVPDSDVNAGYYAMSQDTQREAEANDWTAIAQDFGTANVWQKK